MVYLALIADIVASQEIRNRSAFQNGLLTILNRINHDSAQSLSSPFTITLGDEFQALYRNTNTVLVDIFDIITEIHPNRVRFGLALGEITT